MNRVLYYYLVRVMADGGTASSPGFDASALALPYKGTPDGCFKR